MSSLGLTCSVHQCFLFGARTLVRRGDTDMPDFQLTLVQITSFVPVRSLCVS